MIAPNSHRYKCCVWCAEILRIWIKFARKIVLSILCFKKTSIRLFLFLNTITQRARLVNQSTRYKTVVIPRFHTQNGSVHSNNFESIVTSQRKINDMHAFVGEVYYGRSQCTTHQNHFLLSFLHCKSQQQVFYLFVVFGIGEIRFCYCEKIPCIRGSFFLLLVVICVFLIIIFSFSWPQILHVIHSSCSPIISHRNIAKCWCGSNRIGHFFINKRSAMTSRTHISYSHNVYFTPFCTQIDRYIDR